MAETDFLTLAIRFKDEFSAQAKKASGEMENLANSFKKGMDDSTKSGNALVERLGRGFGMLMSPIGLVTAGIGGLGVALRAGVKQAVEFQLAMEYVAINLGKTGEQIRDLYEGVERLAPSLGREETGLAGALEMIADAGHEGSDALLVLERSAMLATATHTDLLAVTDSLTKQMLAFNLSAGEAADFTNKLFQMSVRGVGNFQDLLMVTEMLAGSFRAAGLSSDQLLATVAHMSTQFPRSREIIMGMRQVLESLRTPSDKAIELAAKLGIQFDLAGLKTKGLTGFFQDLIDKTKGSEAALNLLLGTAGAWKIAAAMAGEAGQQWQSIFDDLISGQDRLAEANKQVMGTMAKSWDQFRVALGQFSREMGEDVSPALKSVLDYLSGSFIPWLRYTVDFFKSIGMEIQRIMMYIDLATKSVTGGVSFSQLKSEIKAINDLIAAGYEDIARKTTGPSPAAPSRAKKGAGVEGKRLPGAEKVDQLVADIVAGAKTAGESFTDEYLKYMDKLRTEDTKDAEAYHKKILDQWNKETDAVIKLQVDAWKEYLDNERKGEEELLAMKQEEADLAAEIAQADVDREEEAAEKLAARRKELWMDWMGTMRGFSVPAVELVEKFREAYGDLYELTKAVANDMQTALGDLFFDVMTNKLKTWRDYVSSLLNSLARDVSDQLSAIVMNYLKTLVTTQAASAGGGGGGGGTGGLVMGIVGAVVGALTKSGGSSWGGIGSAGASMYHSGGVLRKMHWGGLAADEGLFIGQTGERVLSRAQNRRYEAGMGSGGGQKQAPVIIINAVDAKSFGDLCRRSPGGILAAFSESMSRSGVARSAIQGSL